MENQTSKTDKNIVRSLYEKLLESWNDHDADSFANLFADNGNTIGFDGSQMNGRQEIKEELSRVFSDHKVSSYVGIIREVRSLGPTVFLLRAVAGMVPPGKSDINPKTNAIQSLIAVKEQEEFHVCLYHNTPAAFHERPELSRQLTEELQQVADNHQIVPG